MTVPLLWLALIGATAAMAADLSAPVQGYAPDFNHTSWTELQGAPPDVLGIDQSADGFLWLASAWGLVRFDGQRFERIGPPPSSAAPQPNASTLLVLPDQSIWVAYRNGGADLYQPTTRTFTHYAPGDGLPAGRLFSFVEFHGEVWANAFEGLYRFRDRRWERISGTQGLPARAPNYLLKDTDGDLLMFVPERGWLRLDRPGGTPTPFPALRGELATLDGAGGHWSADGPRRQLIHTRGSQQTIWPLPLDITADLLRDTRGDLWVSGFHRDGIAHFSASALRGPGRTEGELLDAHVGLSSSSILSLYEDRQHQVWVGTTLGLDRFAPRAVHLPPRSSAWALPIPLPNDEMLLISRFAAPILLDSQLHPIPAPAPPSRFDAAAGVGHIDRRGTTWIGGYDSLWTFEAHRFRDIPIPAGVQHRIVQALADMPDGSLWASFMDLGLWHRVGTAWRRAEDPLLSGICTTLLNTPDGVLFGFTDGRLVEVTEARTRLLPAPEAEADPLGRVMAMARHGDDIWIGGDRGLEHLREGRRQPVRLVDGETLGLVTGLAIDGAGDLWINETDGFVRIRALELERLAQDPQAALHLDRFGAHDGVRGALNPRNTQSLRQDALGRLWASRGAELLWFYPDDMAVSQPPPKPLLMGASAPLLGGDASDPRLEVTSGDGARVQFTAVDLHQAEAVRFRARIVGLPDGWHDLSSRQFNFGGLAPGHYKVEIQASAPRSAWGLGGTLSLPVTVLPRWYQTWTFRVLAALAAIGLLALVYRRRVRLVIRREQERLHAQLNERERIARELHDHLLQGTIGLTLQVGQTARRLPAGSTERSQLEGALERAEHLLEETREELHNLRAHQSDAPFDEALAREIQAIRAPRLPAMRVVPEGNARPLQPLAAAQLRAIAMEAVRNALKHTTTEKIDITVHYSPRHLRVSVRDYGDGLPAAGAAGVMSLGAGLGMAGMKERAGLIGGRLRLVSEPERGTVVEIEVPARRAYAR